MDTKTISPPKLSNKTSDGTWRFVPLLPRTSGKTRIQATFLIQHEAQELYLHLFLAKESLLSNIYAPMSYIVLTKRDDNPKLYFEGQEHKKVIKLEILPIPKKTQIK